MPFLVILESIPVAKAVKTTRIDMQADRYVLVYQRLSVIQTILHRHQLVCCTHHDERLGSGGLHLFLVAVAVDERGWRIRAQQVVARSHVGEGLVHRDDWIQQNLEVGPCSSREGMGGECGSQMSSS